MKRSKIIDEIFKRHDVMFIEWTKKNKMFIPDNQNNMMIQEFRLMQDKLYDELMAERFKI